MAERGEYGIIFVPIARGCLSGFSTAGRGSPLRTGLFGKGKKKEVNHEAEVAELHRVTRYYESALLLSAAGNSEKPMMESMLFIQVFEPSHA